MKQYIFLFLFLIISCKKNESNIKVSLKDETLDLKYEVLNQLIENDSIAHYHKSFIYMKTLLPATINKDSNDVRPLGVDLKYDSIFLVKDSAYYKNQEKINLKFKLDKSKIKGSLRYMTDQEFQKMRENPLNNFWDEFYKKYEHKCMRSYSVPFFIKDKTMCVVQNSTSCGILDGIGYIGIYKKINGKWIMVSSYSHWIS